MHVWFHVYIGGVCIGAYFAVSLIMDFESMVRRRLSIYFHQVFAEGWAQSYALKMQSVTNQVLLPTSNSLISKFQDILSRQRKIREDKDATKAHLQGLIDYFSDSNMRIRTLLSGIELVAL